MGAASLVPVVPLIRLVAGTAGRSGCRSLLTDQLRQLKLDNVGPLDGVRTAFGFDPRPMEGGLDHLQTPSPTRSRGAGAAVG
jgi:hypothetical protein